MFPWEAEEIGFRTDGTNAMMTTTVFNISQLVISLSTLTNLIQGKDDLFPGKC